MMFADDLGLVARIGFPQTANRIQTELDLLSTATRELSESLGQVLSLHDDPCPYDAATTRAIAKQRLEKYRNITLHLSRTA